VSDVGHDRGEDAFLLLRGKGRWFGGPAADDADGPLEFDPVWVDARLGRGPADQGADRVAGEQVAVVSCRTMSGLLDRSTRAGPRRDVLSWAFPISCSHL
jgi:hypothetical protein